MHGEQRVAFRSVGYGNRNRLLGKDHELLPMDFPIRQRKLYIDELHIHPIKVRVSFSFRSGQGKCFCRECWVARKSATRYASVVGAVPKAGDMLSDTSMEPLEWHTLNPLRFALNAMGATLANVENAPLRLNALILHNSFATPETILGKLYSLRCNTLNTSP